MCFYDLANLSRRPLVDLGGSGEGRARTSRHAIT